MAAILVLACLLPLQAAKIVIPDFSLTPDGGNSQSAFGNTNISTPNGGEVLPDSGNPVVYVVSTFHFGANSDAHLHWQFFLDELSGKRIGLEVQDTGLVQPIGLGNGILQGLGPTTPKFTTVNLDKDMAGQSITLLAKLKFDPDLAKNHDARAKLDGFQTMDDNTLMNVWIDPDERDEEGTGITAGDLYAAWNTHSFSWFRQTILNQSTPATSGVSSITNTRILTGEDATFANALALAKGSAGLLLVGIRATESAINLEFSKALDRQSATQADNFTISLKGGGESAVIKADLSGDGRSLTLTPAFSLIADGSVFVLDLGKLRAADGTPVAGNRSIEFLPN